MKALLPTILAVVFMSLAGMADALCFTSVARVWQRNTIIWPEVGKAAIWVSIGFVTYLVAAIFLTIRGVTSAELQTMIWFAMTTIGVATISRQFLNWSRPDQLVAVLVLGGIIWLLLRTPRGK